MINLYELLGVKKNAGAETIRKAYRKKAKKAHPDAGGSAECFAMLKKAQDILLDPTRRAKYDATGEVSETAIDNSLSAVVQILAMALESVLTQIENRSGQLTEFALVEDMKLLLGGSLDEIQTRRRKVELLKVKTEKLVGRFGVKNGYNYLEGIVTAKISSLEQTLRQCSEQEEPVKKALDILSISDFKADASSKKEGFGYGGSSYRLAELMNKAMYGVGV